MYDPNLHLFVDEEEIDARWGFRRVLARPAERSEEPVLIPDRPWEGTAVGLWASVLYDESVGHLVAWYRAMDPAQPGHLANRLCYATSSDGLTWDKPDLGVVEFAGSSANNIVYSTHDQPDVRAMETHGVIVDEVGAPDRRYKLVAYHGFQDRSASGLWGLFSPDGIHWTRTKDALLPKAGDRHSAMKDPEANTYLVYTRRPHGGNYSSPQYPDPFQPGTELGDKFPYKRLIARTTSKDFLTWSEFETVMRVDDWDAPGTQFYSIAPFRYGNRYLAWVDLYDADIEKMCVTLASSMDGIHWNRPIRDPFLHVGPDGRWDDTWLNVSNNPPVRQGNKLRFFTLGRDTGHRLPIRHGSIGTFTLTLDRFAGMVAGRKTGHLSTAIVAAGGPGLFVNARTVNGMARVAIHTTGGDAIPGYTLGECDPITVDSVDHPVTWNGKVGLGTLAGTQVRLHIEVNYGTIYAYRFGVPERKLPAGIAA